MANFAKYQRKSQWCCKIAAPSAVSDEHGACARLFEGQLVILILRSQLRKVWDVYNDVNYLLFCESTPTQHTLRGYCAQTKKKRDDKLWLCFGLLVSHYYSSPSLLIMFCLSAFILYATTWDQRCLNTHRCVILMRTSGVFGERYFLGVSAHVLAVIHTTRLPLCTIYSQLVGTKTSTVNKRTCVDPDVWSTALAHLKEMGEVLRPQ